MQERAAFLKTTHIQPIFVDFSFEITFERELSKSLPFKPSLNEFLILAGFCEVNNRKGCTIAVRNGRYKGCMIYAL